MSTENEILEAYSAEVDSPLTEEHIKKGQLVRKIIENLTKVKTLEDHELFKICDALLDKSLTELYYIEKLHQITIYGKDSAQPG